MKYSLGLRYGTKPQMSFLRGIGQTSGYANLTAHAGEIVDQNDVGHCTTALAKAVCCALSYAGTPIGEPSHRAAYQLALRIDRAADYPDRHADAMPLLEDVGSTLATMCTVLTRYGIAPKGKNVVVGGRERASDCSPSNATAEQGLSLLDAVKAAKRVVVGPHELDLSAPDQGVQWCLDHGWPVADGGYVDTRYMERTAVSAPYGRPDLTDPNGGGHAQMIVGYTTHTGVPLYCVQNSWGKEWGDGGRTWVTSEYLRSRWVLFCAQARLCGP